MNALLDRTALADTLANAQAHLLELRGDHGYWTGELSSSALSTATAVAALEAYRQAGADDLSPRHPPETLGRLIEHGRAWLTTHQNSDGGWGDTTLSISNISTTALCWAALAGTGDGHAQSVASAEQWLSRAAGGLDPPTLAAAIRNRYGKDHTFSVPILTTLALADRLGSGRAAWQYVPQLPFEVAAFPHRWYAGLQLPVVSYALPALIAIGQVRHHHCPTNNPLARVARSMAKRRTLRVLEAIQPTSGGFLEATPLTSFVALSLIGAGQQSHPVVRRALEFLIRSVRADGSWPIDTNLATWVTTLSIHALNQGTSATGRIGSAGTAQLRRWLLEQQYHAEHPYTHAAPGGWAWTDLPGGVPDADDTPGALLALRSMGDGSHRVRDAAVAGIGWLLDLQNADGGMPTFCRGWGRLPFDRSSADLTAHALRAWIAWRNAVPSELQRRIDRATRRALDFLARVQRPGGAWEPLWFGNQYAEEEVNLTYGTSRVLVALAALGKHATAEAPRRPDHNRALAWILQAQNDDGGWGGTARTPSSIEETAQALEAICASLAADRDRRRLDPAMRDGLGGAARGGVHWLIEQTNAGRQFPPSPIGFYFAKLWYYERIYPVSFAVAALGQAAAIDRLLYPQEIPAGTNG